MENFRLDSKYASDFSQDISLGKSLKVVSPTTKTHVALISWHSLLFSEIHKIFSFFTLKENKPKSTPRH